MSSGNNRLRRPVRIKIHSDGYNPKTPDDVMVHWSTEAKKLKELIQPCLERSLEKYLEAGQAELLSEYMGGSIVVVTWKEKHLHQFVAEKEELEQPEFAMMKEKVERMRVPNPARGSFWTNPEK